MKIFNVCVKGNYWPLASRWLLIMKLAVFLTLVAVLQATAGSFAQQITLKARNISLTQAMRSVQNQSGYPFFLMGKEVANTKVSVQVENASLEETMAALLKDSPLSWTFKDNTIIIKQLEQRAIAAVIPGHAEIPQQREITGRVTNERGEPLEGITVTVKGTTAAVTTNSEGNYHITIPQDGTALIFTSVGYATRESPIGASNTINVTLNETISDLDEVVVVGFGTQKKVNLTGSVSTVDTKLLEARPVANAVQALQGTVPGLNIYQNNGGEIGTASSINIRGITTIGQGSNGGPLILIDGMEADITTLNPQDIEGISVLKDAAASSIYGSRAPFGVILITTKSGKSGKAQINYNNNFRWNSPLLIPEMADSYSFALYMNDLLTNAGREAWFTAEHLQRILDFQAGRLGNQTTIPNPNNPNEWSGYDVGNDNVDWYDAIYKDRGFSQEHSLSVSGGTTNSSYYISGNYLDQNGLLQIGKDGAKRYTGAAKLASQIAPWARIEYGGRFVRYETTRPQTYRGQHDFWFAEQAWPTLPLYDPNGYYFSAPSAALFLAEGGTNDFTSDKAYHQLNITTEPIKGIKVIGDINYAITDDFRTVVVQKLYNHNVAGEPILYNDNNSITEYAYKTNYLNSNVRAEYQKSLNMHNFMLMGGFQAEQTRYRDLSANRVGIFPALPTINTSTGVSENGSIVAPEVSGQYYNWSTAGFFGRFNYDYMGKYLLEANLRYDGSSRFRSDNRWSLFPSFSLGWNIAHESFWENLNTPVEVLKLRASWGKLGNQNTTSYYPTYSAMGLGTASGGWLVNGVRTNTAYAPALVSPSLTWEKISTYNIGLDIAAFNNRLTSSIDVYTRYTNDMVGPAIELPVILGTGVPRTNNTDLRTSGFELEFAWRDNLANGLGYDIRFNVSDSRTKIIRYPNDTGVLGYNSGGTGEVQYSTFRDGETYGEIWGYTTIGIAQTQAEMDAHLAGLPNGAQDAIGTNWGPGDIMYADLNGDGKVDNGSNTIGDHGDLTVIGNITPRFLFGFNLGANYKAFDISVFFQGIMKRDYFQGSYLFWGNGKSMWESTAFVQHLDYFRDDPSHPLGANLDAYYPRPLDGDWSGMGRNHEVQSKYLQNAAYIRLKNLQLGYSLPMSTIGRTNLQRLRVYVSGENLWTGTKLTKIFDPELIDNPGSGGSQYPLSKVWSIGLNLTF